MAIDDILILHLSDLHFGENSRFKGVPPDDLAGRLLTGIKAERVHHGLPGVGLIVVSGDVAQQAKPAEFTTAVEFLAALAGHLGLERSRIVVVPGNHDVSWTAGEKVELEQRDEGFNDKERDRRIHDRKLNFYREFTGNLYEGRTQGEVAVACANGAYVYIYPELDLAVAALNSCEQETHRDSDHFGRISAEQTDSVLSMLGEPGRADMLRIAALHHHPFPRPGAAYAEALADLAKIGRRKRTDEIIRRFASDVAGLEGRNELGQLCAQGYLSALLHGHVHADDRNQISWNIPGSTQVLGSGSMGLHPDKLPEQMPNTVSLVRLLPSGGVVQRYCLWFDPAAVADGFTALGGFAARGSVPYQQTLSLPPAMAGARIARAATPAAAAPQPARLDLEAYRRLIRTRYNHLRLQEMASETHDLPPIGLSAMFVKQNVRECVEYLPRAMELPEAMRRELEGGADRPVRPEEAQLQEARRRAYADQSPRPVTEVIADAAQPRLVLLGDPGAGKSVLLQYLALEWADGKSVEPERIRLYVDLRAYARSRAEAKCEGLRDFIAGHMGERLCADGDAFGRWLDLHPATLLFDGLDEIFDAATRATAIDDLKGLAERGPATRVVVTSRVIGYRPEPFTGAKFRQHMLQELDDDQVMAFTARWHDLAYPDKSDGAAKVQRLQGALSGSAAIRRLAGNPLLLTMMCILNRTRELPRDRTGLYEECGRLLLHQWKTEEAWKSDDRLKSLTLDPTDKVEIMCDVARAMQEGEAGLAGNLIGEKRLLETLTESLQRKPQVTDPEQAARALVEHLRGRNFMLCSLGGGLYAFVHRTILEHFCAEDLRRRFEKSREFSEAQLVTRVFGGHWQDEVWHETLKLLAGRIDARFVGMAVDYLLKKSDPGQARNVFLAADLVGEVRDRSQLGEAERRCMEATKDLVGFDLATPYEPWDSEGKQVGVVRRRAVAAVATIWHAAETAAWLRHQAMTNADWLVRWAAAEALAQGWRDDPDTLVIVKDRATRDPNEFVRLMAREALVQGWRADPETLGLLRDWAQASEDWGVRRAAVQALARGWRDDPETLVIVKDGATQDPDGLVRWAAVKALAEGWPEDPETLVIVKDRAAQDPDWAVRRAAVEALAEGWRDDPATLGILKDRATQDPDDGVRQVAVVVLAQGWRDDPEVQALVAASRRQPDGAVAADG